MLGVIVSGGIGSGKSTVSEILMDAGAAVVHADEIGHLVLEPEGEAFSEVADRWPQVVEEGVINRSKLAQIVFTQPTELASLESITHPAIGRKIGELTRLVRARIFVLEVPIMANFVGEGWKRIVVVADEATRRDRLRSRGMHDQDIDSRMAAQPTDDEWLEVADRLIVNNGTVDELQEAVTVVLEQLLAEQA